MPPPPKLLEQYRERPQVKHYGLRTEEAYGHRIRRFIFFSSKGHPDVFGEAEVTARHCVPVAQR